MAFFYRLVVEKGERSHLVNFSIFILDRVSHLELRLWWSFNPYFWVGNLYFQISIRTRTHHNMLEDYYEAWWSSRHIDFSCLVLSYQRVCGDRRYSTPTVHHLSKSHPTHPFLFLPSPPATSHIYSFFTLTPVYAVWKCSQCQAIKKYQQFFTSTVSNEKRNTHDTKLGWRVINT